MILKAISKRQNEIQNHLAYKELIYIVHHMSVCKMETIETKKGELDKCPFQIPNRPCMMTETRLNMTY